jgi:hypothetical protein
MCARARPRLARPPAALPPGACTAGKPGAEAPAEPNVGADAFPGYADFSRPLGQADFSPPEAICAAKHEG